MVENIAIFHMFYDWNSSKHSFFCINSSARGFCKADIKQMPICPRLHIFGMDCKFSKVLGAPSWRDSMAESTIEDTLNCSN